jgi:hypothetical protein
MPDVTLSRIELIDFSLVDVIAQDPKASVDEYVDEWYAHVPEAEHSDHCLPLLDAIHERLKLRIVGRHSLLLLACLLCFAQHGLCGFAYTPRIDYMLLRGFSSVELCPLTNQRA